jgi:hypothetical protein
MTERYIMISKVSSSAETLRPEIAIDENAKIAPSIHRAAFAGLDWGAASLKIWCPSLFHLPLAGLMCKIKPMRIFTVMAVAMMGGQALADTDAIERAVHLSFDDMPRVERANSVAEVCGAAGQANTDVVFCTSENVVYLRNAAPQAAYKLAHVMGHAVQVRHGIADIALREIRRRPEEESALRALVTRQVECIAGFLTARAGLPVLDFAVFEDEPFAGSHWGRNPLRIGPKVSIGLAARAEWFGIGFAGENLAVCAVGEMGAELLLAAYRS